MRTLSALCCAAMTMSAAADVDCSSATSVVQGHNLKGKVIVQTGGDTGLGLETSKALALTQATVVIASYNVTYGSQIAAEIAASSGNPNVEALGVDLSNFSSVRELAAEVLGKYKTIHALINDAGIGGPPTSLPPSTADNFERTFQVNYLGPFLLTELLLPALRAASPPGRVINVASLAGMSACMWRNSQRGCMAPADWQTVATTPNGTVPPTLPVGSCGLITPSGCNAIGTPASNYGVTKFAQEAHAFELDRIESGVRAVSLHPGFVETPMTATIANATATEWCAPLPYKPGVCPIPVTAGAATQAYLAVVEGDSLVGGAFYRNCTPSTRASAQGWDWDSSPTQFYSTSKAWLNLSTAL